MDVDGVSTVNSDFEALMQERTMTDVNISIPSANRGGAISITHYGTWIVDDGNVTNNPTGLASISLNLTKKSTWTTLETEDATLAWLDYMFEQDEKNGDFTS